MIIGYTRRDVVMMSSVHGRRSIKKHRGHRACQHPYEQHAMDAHGASRTHLISSLSSLIAKLVALIHNEREFRPERIALSAPESETWERGACESHGGGPSLFTDHVL